MEWYKNFYITWQVFGFQSSDIWNMDKSGFMVGMGKNQKVITKDPCWKLYLGSSTNHELVTVVEAISAGGRTIPPIVILPGKCQQEHRYDCTSIEDQALVAVSDSGFLNDKLALEWVKHFNKYSTKDQAGVWWMLLLDGHRSHCTYKFLNYCTDADILLFCLPPHTTHILQPLDVVVFQPYKYWHTQAIDEATCTRCDDFNKMEFLEALGSIRAKTFKTSTILSVFKKTGLYPYNPAKVLDKLQTQEKEDKWEDISNPKNNDEQPTTPPPLMKSDLISWYQHYHL